MLPTTGARVDMNMAMKSGGYMLQYCRQLKVLLILELFVVKTFKRIYYSVWNYISFCVLYCVCFRNVAI